MQRFELILLTFYLFYKVDFHQGDLIWFFRYGRFIQSQSLQDIIWSISSLYRWRNSVLGRTKVLFKVIQLISQTQSGFQASSKHSNFLRSTDASLIVGQQNGLLFWTSSPPPGPSSITFTIRAYFILVNEISLLIFLLWATAKVKDTEPKFCLVSNCKCWGRRPFKIISL